MTVAGIGWIYLAWALVTWLVLLTLGTVFLAMCCRRNAEARRAGDRIAREQMVEPKQHVDALLADLFPEPLDREPSTDYRS